MNPLLPFPFCILFVFLGLASNLFTEFGYYLIGVLTNIIASSKLVSIWLDFEVRVFLCSIAEHSKQGFI